VVAFLANLVRLPLVTPLSLTLFFNPKKGVRSEQRTERKERLNASFTGSMEELARAS
jgi:hypothetical protein